MATYPESHRELLNAPVGMLATIGRDGYPQVTATWFLFDEELVKISLNTTRQKYKNLRDHPECTFFILDPANPYRTIEVRAQADIQPDTDYAFAKKLGGKYNADVTTMDAPGQSRVVVTLRPIKINIWGS